MRNFKIIIPIAIISLCYSCCKTDEELKKLLTIDDNAWLNSWKQNPLKKFRKGETYPIHTYDYGGFYCKHATDTNLLEHIFNVYSPSKMYSVDIYSVRYFISEDFVLEGADPDSEVLLNDFAKEKSLRLLYSGPSGKFDEIRWISDSCFIIFGDFEGCPTILIFDIQNFLLTLYSSPKNTQKYFYAGERFKRMKDEYKEKNERNN